VPGATVRGGGQSSMARNFFGKSCGASEGIAATSYLAPWHFGTFL